MPAIKKKQWNFDINPPRFSCHLPINLSFWYRGLVKVLLKTRNKLFLDDSAFICPNPNITPTFIALIALIYFKFYPKAKAVIIAATSRVQLVLRPVTGKEKETCYYSENPENVLFSINQYATEHRREVKRYTVSSLQFIIVH